MAIEKRIDLTNLSGESDRAWERRELNNSRVAETSGLDTIRREAYTPKSDVSQLKRLEPTGFLKLTNPFETSDPTILLAKAPKKPGAFPDQFEQGMKQVKSGVDHLGNEIKKGTKALGQALDGIDVEIGNKNQILKVEAKGVTIATPFTNVRDQENFDRKQVGEIMSGKNIFGAVGKLAQAERALNDTGMVGFAPKNSEKLLVENAQWFNQNYSSSTLTDTRGFGTVTGYPWASVDKNGKIDIRLYNGPNGRDGEARYGLD